MTNTGAVAKTILQQLGGGAFVVMTGAHSFVFDASVVQLKFKAPATNGANCLRIELEPTDTYRVEFWKVRGANAAKVTTVDGVFAEDLRGLFERETGLRVSL
jgi:hypothetical protein